MFNSLIRLIFPGSTPTSINMNKSNKKSCYTFVPFQIEYIIPNVRQGLPPSKKGEDKGILTPLPRSGHRMICIGSDLYVFGGYNQFIQQNEYNDDAWIQNCPLFKELWKFNTISRCWTRLKNVNGMPNELASHSAIACSPHMIIYGGTATPFGEASSNSVHLCYLPKEEWTTLRTRGSIVPTPMYGQAMCREKDELFVVGGTTGFEYSLDVHVLNLKTLQWKYLIPNTVSGSVLPESRYRHEAVVYENCLYVFGGGTSEKAFPLHSLPTFDLGARVWMMTKTYPDAATGEFPKPRKCHVLVEHNLRVYIQGGTNEAEHLNDFWTLDLSTMTWRRLEGKTKKPIYFHSGAVTEEGTIYLFGGIWEAESTRTNKIFKVHVDVPSLLTMAWQAVDFYAPHLMKLPYSKLLELGIPPLIAESLKSVSEVG